MRARVLLYALLGLALPIGLALGVYASAGRSLTAASVADPVTVTTRVIAQPSTAPTTTESREEREQGDDRSGRCQEPEHRADPECVSGGESGEDRDSSGSGSDNSGPGGGSDDSSGSASSGSSGSGSGSSGSSGSGGGDD
jgi:hypothetical protein